MTFCQNCGSSVEGKFCAKCGAPQAQDTGPQTAPPPISPGGSSGLADNIAGALCYVPIVAIIFLLVEPYSRNKLIRFHAFQSLFLLAAMIVTNIAITAVFEIFWSFWGLFGLVRLAFFAIWVFLIIKTYQGEKMVRPVIGPLAEKQA